MYGYPFGRKLPMQHPLKEDDLTDVEVPLYVEPFNSWRTWDLFIDSDIVSLRSITYKAVWPHNEPLKAECRKADSPHVTLHKTMVEHDAPFIEHGCGIYSVKNKEDCNKWNNGAYYQHMRIIGEIKIWGKVLCFKEGYISEFAYPRYLYVNPEGWEKVKEEHRVDITPNEVADILGRNYDVPIVIGT